MYLPSKLSSGANARLVTDSFNNRGGVADDQCPRGELLRVFPPQTTTFPSLEDVEKNLESWVQAQLHIILE